MPTLQWLGEGAVLAAERAAFRVLEHDSDLSTGDSGPENLPGERVNLPALNA